jgi:hypothetical protein
VQITSLLNSVTGVARRRGGVRQVAVRRRGDRPAGEQSRVQAVLDGAEGEERRAYLRRAQAAGHSVATLERFAARLRDRPAAELRRRLRLVDPVRPGPVRSGGVRVAQIDGTTCGPMTILMARAVADPVYAWWLTGGGAQAVAERLEDEQRRIHRAANLVWPRRLGTTPAGVARAVSRHRPGVAYRWRMVDDADPDSVGPAVEDAVAAVRDGHPVPLLIGALVPRHWVLLIGAADGDRLTFYNPAAGAVARLAAADVRGGRMEPLGFPHLQAVVVPAG